MRLEIIYLDTLVKGYQTCPTLQYIVVPLS